MDKSIDFEFQIVPASIEQLMGAAELRAIMANESGSDWDAAHPGWRERFVDYFARKQEYGEAQLFCAVVGEKIVGISAISLVEDYHSYSRGRKAARVNAVYVIPAYRLNRIASSLMQSAMDWARLKKCTRVRLNATKDGEKLYRSFGFEPINEMQVVLS